MLNGGDERSSFLEGGMGDDTINVGKGYTVVAFYGADGFDTVNGFKSTDSLRFYNSKQSAEELVKAASYHEHSDGATACWCPSATRRPSWPASTS